jgi:ABC-type glycerol-3-phosphate transport system permease component
MSFKHAVPRIVLLLLLFAGASLLFVPIFWTFATSFKTPPEITTVPPRVLPESFLNFASYQTVWQRLHFGRLLINNFTLCAAVLAVSLVFASLTGYGFAKFRFPGKEIAFFAIVGVLMVPFQSVAVPLFRWMDTLGMVDTFLGLSLPLMVSAFGVLLMRESASTIPNDYIEAARIDGCSELRIFLQIIMPMMKPAIAALAIIKFIWTWNEFFWPLLIIMTPTKAVITLGLSYLTNMYFREYHLISAAAILSLLPLFLLFIILRQWMVEALAGTGLKT